MTYRTLWTGQTNERRFAFTGLLSEPKIIKSRQDQEELVTPIIWRWQEELPVTRGGLREEELSAAPRLLAEKEEQRQEKLNI